MPHHERKPFLLTYLRTQIARVMGFDSYKAIEPKAPLFDLGIDSLAAVELKNQLEKDIGCMLRATMIIDYPTCEELISHLVNDVLVFPSCDSAGLALDNKAPPISPSEYSDDVNFSNDIRTIEPFERSGG
jgi:myxalamid-type polyketide synthase MxaB